MRYWINRTNVHTKLIKLANKQKLGVAQMGFAKISFGYMRPNPLNFKVNVINQFDAINANNKKGTKQPISTRLFLNTWFEAYEKKERNE